MKINDDALRWMAYQANRCNAVGCPEAICLVAPAIAEYLRLPPMTQQEARAFDEVALAVLKSDLRRAA